METLKRAFLTKAYFGLSGIYVKGSIEYSLLNWQKVELKMDD